MICLSTEDLKDIYNATIEFMVSEMIETTTDHFELNMTIDALKIFRLRLVVAKLFNKNPMLAGRSREEVSVHVLHNMSRLQELERNQTTESEELYE